MNEMVIEFEGYPGTIGTTGIGFDLTAKWASHTGYRHHVWDIKLESSVALDINNKKHREVLENYAYEQFLHNKQAPFLVGRHDCELWHNLWQRGSGSVTIRLPQWHNNVVSKCLESYGFILIDQWNHLWSLPADQGHPEVASQLLKPLLKKGTRLTDEAELAAAVDMQAQHAGYVPRKPLSQGHRQGALF